MTLIEMLQRAVRKTPEKTAIVFREKQITYLELNDMVSRLAGFFLANGLKKGDRIGLMLPRTPELVIGFLAAARAHGVAVPVNFELVSEDLEGILKKVAPKWLIVHSDYLGLARSASSKLNDIGILVTGEADDKSLAFDDVLITGSRGIPALDIRDQDIVYLNYTSGSTGNSRGAATTHANIHWNTVASVEALLLTEDDVHLCIFAPFAHPHEIFARPLFLGGTMVLVDTTFPKSIAHAIIENNVTCVMGLAPMYEKLIDIAKRKNLAINSIRIAESGGMYTLPELIQRFKEQFGVSITPVWGSTETTGIALANRPGAAIPAGSVGTPCKSYEIRIIDESGDDMPDGEIGEMVFKGPAVVSGYDRDREATDERFIDGWYYSGDLGKKDGEGNFYFVERKFGMMKVAGHKVYPLEIELALMKHPDIEEVAVIAESDRLRGETPKAIVVPANGAELSKKDVIRFCQERLARYKVPRHIEFRSSLPKIGSGKINKKLLQPELV